MSIQIVNEHQTYYFYPEETGFHEGVFINSTSIYYITEWIYDDGGNINTFANGAFEIWTGTLQEALNQAKSRYDASATESIAWEYEVSEGNLIITLNGEYEGLFSVEYDANSDDSEMYNLVEGTVTIPVSGGTFILYKDGEAISEEFLVTATAGPVPMTSDAKVYTF